MWKPANRLLLSSALVLGGLAAAVFTHRSQAHEFLRNVGRLPVRYLAGALLLVLAQLGFQSLRLWAVVPKDALLALRRVASAFTIGELFNLVVPARAGDALKVVLLTQGEARLRISVARGAGAVLADKVIDVGSLVLICAAAGLVGLLGAGVPAWLRSFPLALGGGAVLALALLGVRLARPRWCVVLAAWAREVVRGLATLRDPVRSVTSLAFSVGAWAAELCALRVLCGGLGFPLAPPQLVLALVILNVGIGVPVSFANIGVYEAALAFGLSRAGVPVAPAIAIATVHHVLELLGICLGAAAGSLLMRSSLSQALYVAPSSLSCG